MIIDPEANHLSPAAGDTGPVPPLLTRHQSKSDASSVPEDPPPPYHTINFGEPVIGTSNSDNPYTNQFRGLEIDRAKDRDSRSTTGSANGPGLQEIRDGGTQIVQSTMLFVAYSLAAAGGVIEGTGKIVTGLGRAIAYYRALMTRQDH